MWLYAFLKGLTIRKHKNKKNKKKVFFSLKYTTLINPYTNHKKHAFKKSSPKKTAKSAQPKNCIFLVLNYCNIRKKQILAQPCAAVSVILN